MPQFLYHEAQRTIADFGIQNLPDGIAFRRPQVQQALVVFAGDRVLRICKIEDSGSVFEDHRVPRPAEKLLQRAAEGFWSHALDFSSLASSRL